MARQVRIQYEGATYHVMCRGDRQEAIFADDGDRRIFLASLAEAVAKTGWRLHAYVLMGNHYHLLLETPEPNLVRGMAWFQTTYTTRYNAPSHQRTPLWRTSFGVSARMSLVFAARFYLQGNTGFGLSISLTSRSV